MKKVFVIIFAVLFLNGCAQTTSMMGPTYTMAKTGSVVQAGSSVATSYGIKQALGQSPTEYITSLTKKETKGTKLPMKKKAKKTTPNKKAKMMKK